MKTISRTLNTVRMVALHTEHFNHGNDYVVAGQTLSLGLAQMDWLNPTLMQAAISCSHINDAAISCRQLYHSAMYLIRQAARARPLN